MATTYLLDTTVFSDLTKPKPENEQLPLWLCANLDQCHISAVTIHELWFGIERLAMRKSLESRIRATKLRLLYTKLMSKFSGRVLLVSDLILFKAAEIRAVAEQAVGDIKLADAIIAATARRYGMTLVTRNLRDFGAAQVDLLDTRFLMPLTRCDSVARDRRSALRELGMEGVRPNPLSTSPSLRDPGLPLS